MTAAYSPLDNYPALSIVITNYNGRELLERCLPSVQTASGKYPGKSETIVVDDCSTDDSVEYMHSNFPDVRVIQPPHNLGFQGASNLGFKAAEHGIIISLNNDIEVTPDSFGQMAAHFCDPDLFTVSAKLLMWDKTTYLAGRRAAKYEYGHLKLLDEEGNGKTVSTLFSTGGACAFSKDKLSELKGFDPIFHPLYWEDIDLCYRALKRGWKVIYDPGIVLYHKHRATIETLLDPGKLKQVTARNSYLFLWKNLSDFEALASHLIFAPLYILKDLILGRWRFPIGFCMAIYRLPAVFIARRYEKDHWLRKDSEIFRELTACDVPGTSP